MYFTELVEDTSIIETTILRIASVKLFAPVFTCISTIYVRIKDTINTSNGAQ